MVAAVCVALLLSTLLLWAQRLYLTGAEAVALLAVLTVLLVWRRAWRVLLLVACAGLPVVATVATSSRLLAERWPDSGGLADVTVTGTVCEFAREQPGSWRFILTADAVSRTRGVPQRVLVNWYEDSTRAATAPAPGEAWQLNLRLRPPRGLSNPGTFDYERWLFSQRIGGNGLGPANGR